MPLPRPSLNVLIVFANAELKDQLADELYKCIGESADLYINIYPVPEGCRSETDPSYISQAVTSHLSRLDAVIVLNIPRDGDRYKSVESFAIRFALNERSRGIPINYHSTAGAVPSNIELNSLENWASNNSDNFQDILMEAQQVLVRIIRTKANALDRAVAAHS